MGESLYPKTMASQDRVIHMIKRLSRDHTVDVVTHVRDDIELNESRKNLKEICRNFYPLPAINPTNSRFKRYFHQARYLLYFYLFGTSRRHYFFANKGSTRRIIEIIDKGDYDIVQIEYCFQFNIFKHTGPDVFKAIDTHTLLYEARLRLAQDKYGDNIPFFQKRELKKYGESEIEALKTADLVICISQGNYEKLKEMSPDNDNIIIYTGQDIDYFKDYETKPEKNTIVFYGNMGAPFNVSGFFRFRGRILPLIKEKVPDVKVLVVGSNPPESIKRLNNGKDMMVTGFVDDVREYLSKAVLMILPLDISGGFRSRIVDVMALGIPVAGTHNALDSVEMTDGVHGYVTDSDEEIAAHSAALLTDPALREKMSTACKVFVSGKYSIDATYGKLSKYYGEL
jgi:glycosyltransferase involved in cell wall biosynthesis